MYELIVGGCSGSNAPIHPRPYFGHLTTSYGLLDKENKRGFIIDNGTGVQVVARQILLAGVQKVTVFQTHFHADHLEGIYLNSLLFNGLVTELIVPSFEGGKPFRHIWNERFHGSTWPICPEIPPIRKFYGPDAGEFPVGGNVSVATMLLNHPGGSVGYRFKTSDQTIVIATDNELAGSVDFLKQYAIFVSGADTLIADVQYTQDEYEGNVALGGKAMPRIRWGHSTPEILAKTLSDHCPNEPGKIYLTHHDPNRTDEELHRFEDKAKSANKKFSLLKPFRVDSLN